MMVVIPHQKVMMVDQVHLEQALQQEEEVRVVLEELPLLLLVVMLQVILEELVDQEQM